MCVEEVRWRAKRGGMREWVWKKGRGWGGGGEGVRGRMEGEREGGYRESSGHVISFVQTFLHYTKVF